MQITQVPLGISDEDMHGKLIHTPKQSNEQVVITCKVTLLIVALFW
jgi:hypothetical protein